MSVNKKRTRRFHFVPALVALGIGVAFGSVANATVHYRLSEERFKYVAFDASSQVLYAAKERGNVIYRWEVPTQRALESVQSPVDRSEIVWIAPQIDLAVSAGGHFEDRLKTFFWRISDGKLVATHEGRGREFDTFLAISHDGRTCAIGRDDTIILLDLPQGKPRAILKGHAHLAGYARFSPDGKLLASSGGLWDIVQGKEIGTFADSEVELFSPDSKYLITSNQQHYLVWDVRSVLPVARFKRQEYVGNLTFSADGTRLQADDSKAMFEWKYDPSKLQPTMPTTASDRLARLSRKENELPELTLIMAGNLPASPQALSGDGRWFASGSDGLRLWHAAVSDTGNRTVPEALEKRSEYSRIQLDDVVESTYPRRILTVPDRAAHRDFEAVAVAPDGRRVAAAGGNVVNVWDIESREHLRRWEFEGPTNSRLGSISFSADGEKLFLSAHFKSTAKVWEVMSGQELFSVDPKESVYSNSCPPTVAPSGKLLVWMVPLVEQTKGLVQLVLHDATKKSSRRLADPTDTSRNHSVSALSFSKDGKFLVSGHGDGVVKLWDTTTSRWMGHFLDPSVSSNGNNGGEKRGHVEGVRSVSISPAGNIVASTDGQTLKVWDAKSGKLLKAIDGRFETVAVSADGQSIATTSDVEAKVRSAASLQPLANLNDNFLGGNTGDIVGMQFSSDGRWVVVAGKELIGVFDGEPYDGLWHGKGFASEDARWLGRTLTRLGYLKPEAKLQAAVYRQDEAWNIAISLPKGATDDEVIVTSIRNEVGSALAQRFGPKLAIHLCAENFQIERTLEVQAPDNNEADAPQARRDASDATPAAENGANQTP